MDLKQFRHDMTCGLGRCYVELRQADDPEPYRQIVEWGCTHSFSYNVQSDGCRAPYVYELTQCFADPLSFVPVVVEAYAHYDQNDTEQSKHLSYLLGLFARDGSREAAKALERKYTALLAKLRRRERFNGWYDCARDALIDCVEAMMLYIDNRRFATVAKRLGKLLLDSKWYEANDFDNLYYCIAFRYISAKSPRKWLRYLYHDDSPQAQMFLRGYRRAIRGERAMHNRIMAKVALREQEKENAPKPDPEAKLRRLLQAANDVERESALAYYIDAPFTGDPAMLVQWADSQDGILTNTALRVLAHTRGEAVWQYANTLVATKKHLYDAMSMLATNDTPERREQILQTLYAIPVALRKKEYWHGVVQTILDSERYGEALPYDYYWFIYNRSLCSNCRARAVKYLAKKGQLTDAIKAELRHDCNKDIRAIGQA